MIQDIEKNLSLIEDALNWASKYNNSGFPFDTLKKYRRRLKLFKSALEDNCSAAAYGESQVGKSYLMSSLLSTPENPFVIQDRGVNYSFTYDINCSGGKNAQVESTGIVTRFTIRQEDGKDGYVKVRLFPVSDLILLLADSYYQDIKINEETSLSSDVINQKVIDIISEFDKRQIRQTFIDEDDICDIKAYFKDLPLANRVKDSNFFDVVSASIHAIPADRWVDVFSLLWNQNADISNLFLKLIQAYRQINFQQVIYIPFDAVLYSKGTLLDVCWLDNIFGMSREMRPGEEMATTVYDRAGNVLAYDFQKSWVSALTMELTFVLPESLASTRPFLKKMDLLDFPGARPREQFAEEDIKTVLHKVLRRGKVAYLFKKYSMSKRIGSVLFCHHNNQRSCTDLGETIKKWVFNEMGKTAEERATYLNQTLGISPLFFVATKFNMDIEKTPTDKPSTVSRLDDHWNRFNKVIPEIINPDKWFDEWIKVGGHYEAFRSIYPLRDFYWSCKGGIFEGYSDNSPEKNLCKPQDFPDYYDRLKESFAQNEFVQKHFANPTKTWESCATVNKDGSGAIIQDLNMIVKYLDETRHGIIFKELEDIKEKIKSCLAVYYHPQTSVEKNKRVSLIAQNIHFQLETEMGRNPEIFGKILDSLMVSPNEFRQIAINIIEFHQDAPKDFSQIEFIRTMSGYDPALDRQSNIEKLCAWNKNTDEDALVERLQSKGLSLDDILSAHDDEPRTIPEVVARHIINHWIAFMNEQAITLQKMLPHSEEVIYMLIGLMKKLNIESILSKQIQKYQSSFGDTNAHCYSKNAIGDFASLTLNNFISTVGRKYIKDSELPLIEQKANDCNLTVDLSDSGVRIDRQPQPLKQTLEAFDHAVELVDGAKITELRRLPLWDSFCRWENLVMVGLLYASDIDHCDAEANESLEKILNEFDTLYINN